MKKIFLILCVVCFFSLANSNNISDLPKEIKYSGNIKSFDVFSDLLGEHILLTSELFLEKEGKAYLFAYDYIKTSKNSKYKLNWKLEDGINESCDLDMHVSFLANPIITDLNHNNLKEVSLVYMMTCTGDISPLELKVIMRENNNKYGLRGYTLDLMTKEDGREPCCTVDNELFYKIEGLYKNESDFKKIDKSFLEHAKKLWLKYRDVSELEI